MKVLFRKDFEEQTISSVETIYFRYMHKDMVIDSQFTSKALEKGIIVEITITDDVIVIYADKRVWMKYKNVFEILVVQFDGTEIILKEDKYEAYYL